MKASNNEIKDPEVCPSHAVLTTIDMLLFISSNLDYTPMPTLIHRPSLSKPEHRIPFLSIFGSILMCTSAK